MSENQNNATSRLRKLLAAAKHKEPLTVVTMKQDRRMIQRATKGIMHCLVGSDLVATSWSGKEDAHYLAELHRLAPAMCDVIDAAQRALPFFASVIKCGEPWTEQCEAAMARWRSAFDALDRAAEAGGQR